VSALLIVVAGPDKGRSFPLTPGAAAAAAQVGRGSATLTKLTDATVSRLHCEVTWDDGGRAVLANLSDTGTRVNGEPVTKRHLLRHGDLIAVGNSTLRFLLSEMEEAETIMQRPGEGPAGGSGS
jgi:predicted component of type VI protein secretion system